MESLLLASSYNLDRSGKRRITLGLIDFSTPVICISTSPKSLFYIIIRDWEHLTKHLLQLDSVKQENHIIYSGYRLVASYTSKKELVLSYHHSWLDELLHRKPQSVKLSQLEVGTLCNTVPSIYTLLNRLRHLSSGSLTEVQEHPSSNIEPDQTTSSPLEENIGDEELIRFHNG